MFLLFQGGIFRFHVCFQGCSRYFTRFIAVFLGAAGAVQCDVAPSLLGCQEIGHQNLLFCHLPGPRQRDVRVASCMSCLVIFGAVVFDREAATRHKHMFHTKIPIYR